MAEHRHKRDAVARRKPRAAVVAGPIALLATASAVGLGVTVTEPASSEVVGATASIASVAPAPPTPPVEDRPYEVLSRSGSRFEIKPLTRVEKMLLPAVVRRAVAQADTRLWTLEDLNLWTAPGEEATNVGLVADGKRLLVTGRRLFGRAEVVVDGRARWVTSAYLSAEKPEPPEKVEEVEEVEEAEPEAPPAAASCTNGSSVPSGVSPNVAKVHQAVCAAFPEITSYGTFRSDGEHAQGIAIDIMVSGARGWEVAEFVRANYAELGVSYLIYSQKIWSVDRGSEGWRSMEDRGSTTANHYDHVHVTTY